jgi:hypothetical protein
MAVTIAEYLYKRLVSKTKEVRMNVSSMEVLHAQVAQIDTSSAQLLQVEASIDLLTEQALVQRRERRDALGEMVCIGDRPLRGFCCMADGVGSSDTLAGKSHRGVDAHGL